MIKKAPAAKAKVPPGREKNSKKIERRASAKKEIAGRGSFSHLPDEEARPLRSDGKKRSFHLGNKIA